VSAYLPEVFLPGAARHARRLADGTLKVSAPPREGPPEHVLLYSREASRLESPKLVRAARFTTPKSSIIFGSTKESCFAHPLAEFFLLGSLGWDKAQGS